MKLVDQSLKSIETWSVVLSFLKMSPKPAVTFSVDLTPISQADSSIENGNLGIAFYLAK